MELIREINATATTSRLPIALAGEHMTESERVLALEGGADLCLTDICSPQLLAARLRALLRRCPY
ncbi:MAG: hypothetical protein AB1894_08720 [Chloroflexota bacterium]